MINKVKKGSKIDKVSIIPKLVLTISIIFFGAPLYLTIINVFKTTDAISKNPLSFPINPTLENLKYVITSPNLKISSMYYNSLVITVFGTSLCILVSAMAGYYTSRTKNGMARFLYVFFILGLMVPYAIVYMPLVTIFKNFGLMGNFPALVLVFVSGSISFSVFMYHGFIGAIPIELEESAAIDGAGSFRIFWQIIFPLLKPCTATTAIFIGLSMWNDFLTPLLIGQKQTITVGIYTAIGPHAAEWGNVFAFVFYGTFPIVILYLLAQKQFVKGLTSGAVKG
ncbi:carbohydrate ABC transporter permease [Clostridium sp. 2-1]|nr:carbohydrate ABC transporter permease [Clostridium beijerinckii]POO90366.1 carbohydrate ABC transporter permease [Clostridium sp. 2-1]MBN7581193.1 carbohydrate ABC transporter permease [Clostridium beijerinckii]MBN7585780.1 carbohydrate ABC transporter permease [Clostridium beijerinckii]MBO0521392.1 carbohydrate ABC transporter permease [Clostridium beijerinckii]